MRKYSLIPLIVLLLAQLVSAETLPPLVTVPQTIGELWAGYDPQAEPLETEILHSWEQDDAVFRVVRFRVGIFKGETAMVAGVYGYPKDGTNLPALLNIHGGGQFADYQSVLTNAKRGYATLTLAWTGRITAPGYNVTATEMQLFFDGATTDPNYKVTTDWGPLEGYHAPNRFPGSTNVSDLLPAAWTFDSVESPRNSTWFLWTMAARRGLTFLEQQLEVDGDNLGVYGHSMGGKLTVMTAGSDDRVKAAAPSCGGVSDNGKGALYDATIGDVPYLQGISCPVFFLKPSNDFHAHIADVPAAVAEVGPNDWRVTTSPHLNHVDTAAYSVATQIWMDQHLKGGSTTPDSPDMQLDLDTHSGVPSASITVDTGRTINSVEVYYTQQGEDTGEVHPFGDFPFRHWHSARVLGSDVNWTAELPVNSTDEPLWVFANVTYALDAPITGAGYYYASYSADEFVLSTPIASVTSLELKAAGVGATFATTTLVEDFQGDWQKEWFSGVDDPSNWSSTTHKIHDPVYAAPQYSTLAFEVRSEQANTLVVRLNDAAVEVALPGGSVWQEVILYPSDFQSATGPWASDWDGAKELEFSHFESVASYAHGGGNIVVGNLVWSGSAPEFQDLHWMAGTKAEHDARRTNQLLDLPVENGKVFIDVDSAEEVTEIYPTILNAWFSGVPGEPGAPLVVDGVTYPRGITCHAPSEIVYFLGSAFDRFKAIASANSVLGTPIQMQVYLDDVLAFDSGDLVYSEFAPVDLDVNGVSEMRLVVSYTGASSNGAHASWVDAHLTLPQSNDQILFTEDFESYGAPDGTGWDNFGGAFTNASLGFSNAIPGAIFQGSNLLWFDNTTSPLGDLVPYIGATSADDPANIQETYAALSGTENIEIVYAGVTGQTFVEGAQYDLDFTYFNRPNLAGIAFVAELYNVVTGTAVVTSAEFSEIGLNANQFLDGKVSYTATALDGGAEIGIRFRGTPVQTNLNQLGLDNITLTAVSEPDATVVAVFSPADELAYAGDVSGSDLLHGLTPTASGWVLGLNYLNDGVHGLSFNTTGTVEGAWGNVGATAEFAIGSGSNGAGYDITSIQSIAAWNGGTFGNQAWTVEVKAVGGSWTTLATVDYQPLPDSPVTAATKYTLSDSSGVLATGIEAIRFTANSVDGGSNAGAFIWREVDVFGTASAPESIAPTLVSLSPDTVVDGSIRSNVSNSTTLVAEFNEDVELGSGDITIVNLDTLVETVISLPDSQVKIDPIDRSLLMIEPSSVILENTRYAVCIDATVIDDRSGNGFVGIGDTSTWTFTTRGSDPLKVLCIGDSITVGFTDNLIGDPFNFGYRGHLYQLLNDAGYVFQFVGSSTQPWDGSFGLDPTIGGSYKPAFDLRDLDQDYQQGGGGAPIGSVIGWLDLSEPDLILLKIGINSIQTGVDLNDVINNIYNLVDTILTRKPNADLIVAQILPYSGDYAAFPGNAAKNQMLYDYNVYIRDTLVPTFAAAGHKISTVDMYSMFLTDPADYTSAVAVGRHSNGYNHPWNAAVAGAGYDTMAQRWFDAIESLNLGTESFRAWITNPSYEIDPGDRGFDDDPDGDNLANGVEAWFGTSPGEYNPGFTELVTDGTTTSLQHSLSMNPPSGVTGYYEWSLDLVDWYATDGREGPSGGLTVSINSNTVGTTTTATATASEQLERLFLRASVTQN